MIKYRTRWDEIEEVQVAKESTHQVTLLNGRRENKKSEWSNWHDSWEDAHEFMIAKYQKSVDKAQAELDKAAEALMRVTGMLRPR